MDITAASASSRDGSDQSSPPLRHIGLELDSGTSGQETQELVQRQEFTFFKDKVQRLEDLFRELGQSLEETKVEQRVKDLGTLQQIRELRTAFKNNIEFREEQRISALRGGDLQAALEAAEIGDCCDARENEFNGNVKDNVTWQHLQKLQNHLEEEMTELSQRLSEEATARKAGVTDALKEARAGAHYLTELGGNQEARDKAFKEEFRGKLKAAEVKLTEEYAQRLEVEKRVKRLEVQLAAEPATRSQFASCTVEERVKAIEIKLAAGPAQVDQTARPSAIQTENFISPIRATRTTELCVGEWQSETRCLDERLGEITSHLEQTLHNEMKRMDTRVTEFSVQFDALTAKIGCQLVDVEGQVKETFEKRFDDLIAKSDAKIARGLLDVEGQTKEAFEKRFHEVTAKSDAHLTKVVEFSEQMRSHESRFAKFSVQLSSHENRFDELTAKSEEDLAKIDRDVVELEVQVKETLANGQMTNIEKLLEDKLTNGQIANIEKLLDNECSAREEAFADLSTKLDEVTASWEKKLDEVARADTGLTDVARNGVEACIEEKLEARSYKDIEMEKRLHDHLSKAMAPLQGLLEAFPGIQEATDQQVFVEARAGLSSAIEHCEKRLLRVETAVETILMLPVAGCRLDEGAQATETTGVSEPLSELLEEDDDRLAASSPHSSPHLEETGFTYSPNLCTEEPKGMVHLEDDLCKVARKMDLGLPEASAKIADAEVASHDSNALDSPPGEASEIIKALDSSCNDIVPHEHLENSICALEKRHNNRLGVAHPNHVVAFVESQSPRDQSCSCLFSTLSL